MRNFSRAGVRALVFVSAFLVSAACGSADTVWTLMDVTFVGGGTATGSFTIDSTFSTVTDWDITVSGTTVFNGVNNTADFHYTTAGDDFAFLYTDPIDQVLFVDGDAQNYETFLSLFTGTMTNAGGTENIVPTTTAGGSVASAGAYAWVATGYLQSPGEVPEPASILTSGCGALVLGLWLYRRRRSITVNP